MKQYKEKMDIEGLIQSLFGPVFSLKPDEALAMQALEQRSVAWLEARVNRITASNFGAAAGINPYCKPDDLLAQLLFRTFEGNEATAYGTKQEPVACDQYCTSIAQDPIYGSGALEPPKWRDSGLSICSRWPFLGASPDGIVTAQAFSSTVPVNYRSVVPGFDLMTRTFDPSRGIISLPSWTPPTENPHEYLLEIKCPFRKRLYGPIPIYYYAQIQGCMQILDLAYCHFYVWTPTKSSTDCFPRNQSFWDDFLLPRLTDFYFERYMPTVLLKSLGLLSPGPCLIEPRSDVSQELLGEIKARCQDFRRTCGF